MSNDKLEQLRQVYIPGMRIKLLHMHDDLYPVPDGSLGTVDYVDDIGSIHMIWDCGSSLALIPDVDEFDIIQ